LLACRTSTHETTGTTPDSIVFERELSPPCDLLFVAFPDKEKSTTDYETDLVEELHDIHHYAPQYLKMASEGMKAC
jgi:hypothetical protein